MIVAGVDLGATTFHVALLRGDGTLEVVVTGDVDVVVARCAGAARIAVDAPAEPATGRAHPGAPSPKFAAARCCELAAGEQLGIWVPWVTPPLETCPAWMLAGFRLWTALRRDGHEPIEVYPAGCFWLLNGRRWPPRKSSPAGRAERRRLLEPHVGALAIDDHHVLDALMAAVVARGPSRAVGHAAPGCDDSRLHVLAPSAVLEVDGRPGPEGDVGHAEVVDDPAL